MNASRQPANPAAEAIVELISRCFRLNSRLQSVADRMAREVGLTGARWQVLNAVSHRKRPATISDIARWMGLARQSVQQVANALAEQGLVAFEPNPKHQRAPLVVLTEKAANLLDQLDEQRYAWARSVARTLPVADIRVANQVLHTVLDELSE